MCFGAPWLCVYIYQLLFWGRLKLLHPGCVNKRMRPGLEGWAGHMEWWTCTQRGTDLSKGSVLLSSCWWLLESWIFVLANESWRIQPGSCKLKCLQGLAVTEMNEATEMGLRWTGSSHPIWSEQLPFPLARRPDPHYQAFHIFKRSGKFRHVHAYEVSQLFIGC